MQDIKNLIGFILHRKRIVSLNMKDTIDANFESCVSVFRGFFGEPHIEHDLYTCHKEVFETTRKKLYDCNSFVSRYGFSVYCNKTDKGNYKVKLIPNAQLARYLVSKSFNEDFQGREELYRSIR